MEGISKYLKVPERKQKPPRHEKAASVNEIVKVVGTTKQYDYGYWLKMVGKRSYTQILGILKSLESLPKEYKKGAVLTNILRGKKSKNTLLQK